jgi:hypothetical protein
VALFALDHNFPTPIVRSMAPYFKRDELVPVSDIDPSWGELDDWALLVALHRHEREWDGLITTDRRMLALAREMATLCQLGLTLVVALGAGHDPVKAAGLVLAHLDNISTRTRRDVPQLWKLKARSTQHDDPYEELRRIARHQQTTMDALLQEYRIK